MSIDRGKHSQLISEITEQTKRLDGTCTEHLNLTMYWSHKDTTVHERKGDKAIVYITNEE